jgi:hypothetical protein
MFSVFQSDGGFQGRPAVVTVSCQVRSPISPSASTPCQFWKARTAVEVPPSKSPETELGTTVQRPGAPSVRTRWTGAKTSPPDPLRSSGIGSPDGSTAHMAGPQAPSTSSPRPAWKEHTAAHVAGPK